MIPIEPWKIVVQGKTLEEWAKTNPLKLEVMSEQEQDDELREHMVTVYREIVLEKQC